jgi:hypothetical protein
VGAVLGWIVGLAGFVAWSDSPLSRNVSFFPAAGMALAGLAVLVFFGWAIAVRRR